MRTKTRWGLGLLFFGAIPAWILVVACGAGGSATRPAGTGPTDGGAGPGPGATDGPTSPPPDPGATVGSLDATPNTVLPPLPSITNVVATEREDSVGIDFDPVDNAVDYRVYALPNDSDVTVKSDGSLAIKNATYRCAGLRQTYQLPNNTTNDIKNPGGVNSYMNGQYSWSAKIPSVPTVGYVYTGPGADRLPVYTVGVHPSALETGWRESRPKVYTTDASVRQMLLAHGGRDDGISFYVPSAASSATETIYHSATLDSVPWMHYGEYYFTNADMAAHAADTTPPAPAFEVLTGVADGTQPLMSVLYNAPQAHTELSVGKERYKRASNQGPGPLWHVEWSGFTQPTVLVLEALATGCPYQGFLSPQHIDAPPHQSFVTLDELRSAQPTGEVFINGQYDLPNSGSGPPWLKTPNASPVPIARTFIGVTPRPHNPADWDFYEGFTNGQSIAATPSPDLKSCRPNDGACNHWTSPNFDIGGYNLDFPKNVTLFAFGEFLGQFWDAFDDWAQDVTGKVRFAPQKLAQVDADPAKFLHVTWSVDTVSTGRRYPQLIVSDQPVPVEDGFSNPNGNFLIIQTIQGASMRFEVEAFHGLVNGGPWAVNNQAPEHALVDSDTWNNVMSKTGPVPPADPPFEHAGMDRMTKYDAYISASTLYVFVDGKPAACTLYPSGYSLSGSVSVTFGDVLYHEGAETEIGSCIKGSPTPLPFLLDHQCIETKRHWDDIGFKSGVAPPSWDATNFPCIPF